MTEKEKAINDMKKGMSLMKAACSGCKIRCKSECPFYEYCIQLKRVDAPAFFKSSLLLYHEGN